VAVTAIRSIRNSNGDSYFVKNNENPNDTGGPGKSLGVASGQTVPCNMWIPWCTSEADFEGGHFIIMSPVAFNEVPVVFVIWQEGDYVRYSKDGLFHPNGDLVPGHASVGGDHDVQIVGLNKFDADLVLY